MGPVCVTVRTLDELAAAVAAIQTSCEVRRPVGEQAQAFTVAAATALSERVISERFPPII